MVILPSPVTRAAWLSDSAVTLPPKNMERIAHHYETLPRDGAHEMVNDWQPRLKAITSRQAGLRALLSRRYLILQRAALLMLPDLRSNMLLVADNSLQLSNVMMVSCSSGSTRTLME
jgi:hypothetical protein